MNEFTWTAKRERAALLVAQDDRTDERVAADLGIARRTLARWKSAPEFQVRVREHIEAWREHVRQKGIADRTLQIAALHDRWQRMQRLLDARAAALDGVVPGGDTGLLVRVPMLRKVYNTVDGDDLSPTGQSEVVDVYKFDTAVIRELREHEKQAAQALAQWSDKSPVQRQVLVREYVGIPVDDV